MSTPLSYPVAGRQTAWVALGLEGCVLALEPDLGDVDHVPGVDGCMCGAPVEACRAGGARLAGEFS